VVPRFSSAFSALGCVSAEMSYTQQRTVRMTNADWQHERLNAIRSELRDQLSVHFADADRESCTVDEFAAIRYSGQSYAVEVTEPALADAQRLGEQFRARHETLYGFATDEPWELVTLRTTLTAPGRARPKLAGGPPAHLDDKSARTSACWFDAVGPRETPRHARDCLHNGNIVHGPAIVEDAWSTVVLPPGATLNVDGFGHLHIDVGEAP